MVLIRLGHEAHRLRNARFFIEHNLPHLPLVCMGIREVHQDDAMQEAGYRLDPQNNWLQPARRVPSPNCDPRPAHARIELLVVHGISLPPGHFGGPSIDALFTNRLDAGAHPYFQEIAALRVSAHALIRRDGELVQYVPLGKRAWHAGSSSFCGRGSCNDFSVGIELEGTDDIPYEPVQYRRLAALASLLMSVWPTITKARIVGHQYLAPGRKTDPGPVFDWGRLFSLID